MIIGFSVQIAFGIAYIAKNIAYVQMFGDTADYVRTSGSFRCSVYTGVLYPAFLLLIRGIGKLTGLYWYSFAYLLQIALAVTAGYFFLRAFGGKSKNSRSVFNKIFYFWGSAVIATFPLILQNHMAILANSFTLSFLMLETAFVREAWGSRNLSDSKSFSIELGRACLFWLLLGLTEWDYIFIGGVPVLALLIRGLIVLSKTDKKRIAFPIIIATSFLIITVGTYTLTEDKANPARPQKSIEVALFDRAAWDMFRYPEIPAMHIWDISGDELIEECANHRESIKTVAEPLIEETLGVKGSKIFYLESVKFQWTNYKDKLIKETTGDFAAYVMAPMFTRAFLEKSDYISYTPRNYDSFTRNSPVLSKYYMDYSLFWFEAALMMGAVLWILRGFRVYRESKESGADDNSKCLRNIPGLGAIILAVATGLFISLVATFSGSYAFDYKKAGFCTALWIMFIIFGRGKETT